MQWIRMPALLMIALLAFAAAACGTSPDEGKPEQSGAASEHQEGHSEHDAGKNAPSAPKVKMDLPEDAKAGKEVLIQITVTHEGEPVNDADEVQFEIWKKGAPKDDHEMIDDGKNGRRGVFHQKDLPGTRGIQGDVPCDGEGKPCDGTRRNPGRPMMPPWNKGGFSLHPPENR